VSLEGAEVAMLEDGYPERPQDLPASFDGAVCRVGDAFIPATDEGLLRGDGAFEAVRVYLGRPFALQAHLDRLERSCGILLLDCPRDELAVDIAGLVAHCGRASYDLRIVVTRGGHRLVLVEPFLVSAAATRLASVVDSPRLVLDAAKTLSYAGNMLARRRAQAAGGDEALLVMPGGRVLEVQTAAFFFVDAAGRLRTPPLTEGILDSITRRFIVGGLEVVDGQCLLDEALEGREAFVAGTRSEVQPVSAVDGRAFAAPGPLTGEADRVLWRAIEEETGVDRREHEAYLRRAGLEPAPLG
jgi:branched-chain amino acid aminotransferase